MLFRICLVLIISLSAVFSSAQESKPVSEVHTLLDQVFSDEYPYANNKNEILDQMVISFENLNEDKNKTLVLGLVEKLSLFDEHALVGDLFTALRELRIRPGYIDGRSFSFKKGALSDSSDCFLVECDLHIKTNDFEIRINSEFPLGRKKLRVIYLKSDKSTAGIELAFYIENKEIEMHVVTLIDSTIGESEKIKKSYSFFRLSSEFSIPASELSMRFDSFSEDLKTY